MSALTCTSISLHLLKIKVFRIVRKIEKTNSNWANFLSKNERGFESRIGFSLFHLTEYAIHTPPEGLSGSVKFPKEMTFTQLFFGISGTQNRKDQNFLTFF